MDNEREALSQTQLFTQQLKETAGELMKSIAGAPIPELVSSLEKSNEFMKTIPQDELLHHKSALTELAVNLMFRFGSGIKNIRLTS